MKFSQIFSKNSFVREQRKHIILAALLVVLILVGARTLAGEAPLPPITGLNGKTLQGNLLLNPDGLLTVKQLSQDEETLKLSFPEQSEKLHLGSQVEVLRFKLEASDDFTLRTLPLRFTANDIQMSEEIEDWLLVPVQDGELQFNQVKGHLETWTQKPPQSEGAPLQHLIRLRLFAGELQPAQGLLTKQGSTEWAVIAEVKSTGKNPAVRWFFNPEDLSLVEWRPYQTPQAWMKLKTAHSGEFQGPASSILKRF